MSDEQLLQVMLNLVGDFVALVILFLWKADVTEIRDRLLNIVLGDEQDEKELRELLRSNYNTNNTMPDSTNGIDP